MAFTVHDTPVIRTLFRWLGLALFKFTGWKVEGGRPDIPSYVVIAAPHTSNWDFVYTVSLAFIFRIHASIMLKVEWFRWPMGPFMKWLGAIPIDRSRSHDVVSQSIQQFKERNDMVMVIPPSGTRHKVMYWKTGFYHIANGAGVPIVLGYLDYSRKAGGMGPSIVPTGDIRADMRSIREFYKDIRGKYPHTEAAIDPEDSDVEPLK